MYMLAVYVCLAGNCHLFDQVRGPFKTLDDCITSSVVLMDNIKPVLDVATNEQIVLQPYCKQVLTP